MEGEREEEERKGGGGDGGRIFPYQVSTWSTLNCKEPKFEYNLV